MARSRVVHTSRAGDVERTSREWDSSPEGIGSAEEAAARCAGPNPQPADAVALPAAHPGPHGPRPPLMGVIDGGTDSDLLRTVRSHYDNESLMRLQGEIHFDAALSQAEVEVAARVYGRPLPYRAYLPCCGTLRHALPLLERGVERLVAVDLSLPSLLAGLTRNVPESLRNKLAVYHADVRRGGEFLPEGGVPFAFLGGNSLGDITDAQGHQQFITSLAVALAPGGGGVLVFDYVGDRYGCGSLEVTSASGPLRHEGQLR